MSEPWVYEFRDLMTGALIGELPVTTDRLPTRLNSYSTTQFTLPNVGGLSGTELDRAQRATEPALTSVWAYRGSSCVWGGVVWNRTVDRDRDGDHVTLDVGTFDTYLDRRFLLTPFTRNNYDQCRLARDLLTVVFSVTGGDIGIRIGSGTSGQPISRTYGQFTNIYSALRALAAERGGADFRFDVAGTYGDPAGPSVTFATGVPLGRTANNTSLVFDASIMTVQRKETAAAPATNSVIVRGMSAGSAQPAIPITDTFSLDFDGYPLLESVNDQSVVDAVEPLSALANETLRTNTPPIVTTAFDVRAERLPEYGSYVLGDWAEFRVDGGWFGFGPDGGPGWTPIQRIVGIDLQPSATGQDETVHLLTTVMEV